MGSVKRVTGLAGFPVAINPHHTLTALYGKIIRVLAKMPETSVYRKYTDQIVRSRMSVLNKTKDVREIEQGINAGQAEELIQQAEDELRLARNMLMWRPWEPLCAQPPKGQWDWPLRGKTQ